MAEEETPRDIAVDWTVVEGDQINVPDELMPLFNSIGMQLRFHTISGKSEVLTVAHMVRKAEMFFHKKYTGKEAETNG